MRRVATRDVAVPLEELEAGACDNAACLPIERDCLVWCAPQTSRRCAMYTTADEDAHGGFIVRVICRARLQHCFAYISASRYDIRGGWLIAGAGCRPPPLHHCSVLASDVDHLERLLIHVWQARPRFDHNIWPADGNIVCFRRLPNGPHPTVLCITRIAEHTSIVTRIIAFS